MKSKQHKKSNTHKEASISKTMDAQAAEHLKQLRRKKIDPTLLISQIVEGNQTALSRAITLVESTSEKHRKIAETIIKACLPRANKSIRIGITGVPGVGKSTFIESFGKMLLTKGKKVAVLAVDPTSTLSGGSILGDKTRMEDLVKEKNAFIRPSAAGNSLGGVARKTRESIILCEAAGFDTILIETVGVGQSETAVHSMTDFFLLLKLAGAGDELQGIKRGIIEMADIIIINKADGQNKKAAQQAKIEFQRALHLFPPSKSGWSPKTATCSALNQEGIDAIWAIVEAYLTLTKKNGFFESERNEQNKFWLYQTIDEQLKNDFYKNSQIEKELPKLLKAIENHKTSPFEAAKKLFKMYLKK